MARSGEDQPLTAAAGNGSATSNTGSTPGPSGSSINHSSSGAPDVPSSSAGGGGVYGAVSGLVDEDATIPQSGGGGISLGDIYGEREGNGDRGKPHPDADDEAAEMASAVLDAMETDSAKGVHNPCK